MTDKGNQANEPPKRPDAYERYKTFLSGAGVPSRYVAPLTKLALSWLGDGVDVFSERFKAYKKIYISMLTTGLGLESEFKDYYSKTRSGRFRLKVKPIRDFIDWSLQDNDRVTMIRAWLDLVYTVTPKRITDDVFQEWNSYVNTPPKALKPHEELILKSILQDFSQLYGGLDSLKFTSQVAKFVNLEESPRRSPYYNWVTNRMVSSPRSNLICYHWTPLWTTSEKLYSFYKSFPKQVNQCLLGTDTACIPNRSPSFAEVPIGSIACILEQGVKYRWIANPHISVQMVGQPIKEAFASFSNRIPWVYTFNQDLGRDLIRRLQKPGVSIHCFDASKFTDTFSRNFQKMVCSELAKNKTDANFMSQYIETISSSSWQFSPPGGEKISVSWKSGQPLGTGPSFHIACVSHAMVIYASGFLSQLSPKELQLYTQLNVEQRCRLFADYHLESYDRCTSYTGCVGDDSFIASCEIANAYEYLMKLLGVQINKSKSIVSDRLAEFCGKWVLDGKLVVSSKPVMQYSHYSQLVDEVRKYGELMLKHIPFSEVTLFKVLPVLSRPNVVGGTGILPWSEVLTKTTDLDINREITQRTFELFCSGLLVNDVSMGNEGAYLKTLLNTDVSRLHYEYKSESQYLGYSRYYDLNNQWFDCTQFANETETPGILNGFSGLPLNKGEFAKKLSKLEPKYNTLFGNFKTRNLSPNFYGLIDNINRLHRYRGDWFKNYSDRYTHEMECTRAILLGGPPPDWFLPFSNSYNETEVSNNLKDSINDRTKEKQQHKGNTERYKTYRQGNTKATKAGIKWFARYRAQGLSRS